MENDDLSRRLFRILKSEASLFTEALKRAKNGDRLLLYEGEMKHWVAHPHGVLVCTRRGLFLNGREPLCNSIGDMYPHPQGVVHRDGNSNFRLNWRVDLGPYWDVWQPYRGTMLRNEKGNVQMTDATGTSLLVNTYGKDWKPHPEGVVVAERECLTLFRRDGLEVLYRGPVRYGEWKPCPGGAMVAIADTLALNGTDVQYQGCWDRWDVHVNGVVISRGDQLVLIVRKPPHRPRCDGGLNPTPRAFMARVYLCSPDRLPMANIWLNTAKLRRYRPPPQNP
jgi:hypothetical protein